MATGDQLSGISQEAMESLRLPGQFDESARQTALEIDAVLTRGDEASGALDEVVVLHRDSIRSRLLSRLSKETFVLDRYRWPDFLYIPKGAISEAYWPADAPDDHRYGLEWTFPAGTPNRASIEDGSLYAYTYLRGAEPGRGQSSEAGIGIFYQAPFSLGVIDFQPHVDCVGLMRTKLEYFPLISAGSVEVTAHLLLAAWQQIPGGFDLLDFRSFPVATSYPRDQTHGPELRDYAASFDGSNLSARFVVQGARTYLFGVVARLSISSTLTNSNGKPLAALSNEEFLVWGDINCLVPRIEVLTNRVDIP